MLESTDLFEGTAPYYARYRRGYSRELPDALAGLCNLDGTGRLLDLGTGTGALALALAHLFECVVAVDPDGAMLGEASRLAASRGIDNAQFVRARAEELDGKTTGRFRLITVGSAFHWMDRPRIADFAFEALTPGGAFAIVEGRRQAVGAQESALPPIPRDRVNAVIARYLGPKRRAGSGFFSAPEQRYVDLLDRSKFGAHHTLTLPGSPTTRTVDDVIGHLYSTSYGSRRLFGDRIVEFEEELRRELLAASPEGKFFAPAEPTEVIYALKV